MSEESREHRRARELESLQETASAIVNGTDGTIIAEVTTPQAGTILDGDKYPLVYSIEIGALGTHGWTMNGTYKEALSYLNGAQMMIMLLSEMVQVGTHEEGAEN